MLLIIESLLTQGIMFFMTLGESLYYFLTKQKVSAEEPLPLWGLPRSVVSVGNQESVRQNEYTASVLTAEQEQFFQQFISGTNEMEDCMENNYLESVTPIEDPSYESELLSMASWDELEPQAVLLSSKLASKADCRIKDLVIGKQLWVVEVVGEEQGYLHVSDGSAREWVNCTFIRNINKGDILSIFVERNVDNHIDILAIDMLQKYSSDFSIEDELMINDDYFHTESHVVA